MALRIEVDPEKCMGGGNCEFWAPKTFELGDDNISHVVDPEGDPEDKIVLAAQGCPTQAIAVWRDDERIGVVARSMATPLVLVHGGAHGVWCWQPTMPLLTAPVVAVDLPPKSIRGVPAPDPLPAEAATVTLDDWATSTIADIDAAGFDRFVLVGHSMGGLTINEVARRIPERVAHLVFVSSMVPAEGALVMDGVPSSAIDAAQALLDELPDDGSSPAGGMDAQRTRFMFCNDMNDEQTKFVLDHTGTEAFGVFGERVTRRGIPPELPKTYVRLLQDQALPLPDQDRAIENLCESPGGEVEVIELDTGHDVMISAPVPLAAVLDEIANRTEP